MKHQMSAEGGFAYAYVIREHGVVMMEEGGYSRSYTRAAQAIGDDALQRKHRGRAIEDSFTHGTSEQRLRWFMKGYRSGDISLMEQAFILLYSQL